MPSTFWPVKWPGPTENPYPDDVIRAESLAVNSLRQLTLNRVGQVQVTHYPRSCDGYGWHGYPLELLAAADLKRLAGHTFGCKNSGYIRLKAPVSAVLSVEVKGEPLDPIHWQLRDGAYLHRLDGKSWPCTGDLAITYITGHPVPLEGQYAAGVLADEFLRGFKDDTKCRLPRGVTQIVRQGVTLSIETGLFPDGLTGLSEVDAFIYQWNPNALKTRPTVHSPDISYGGDGGGRW